MPTPPQILPPSPPSLPHSLTASLPLPSPPSFPHPLIPSSPSPSQPLRRAFTLIELLVVISIIVVLVGLILFIIPRIQRAAQVANTQAQLNKLQGAINQYYQIYSAYPGPLPDTGTPSTNHFPYVGGRFTDLDRISPVPSGYSLPAPSTNAVPLTSATITESSNYGSYESITGTNNLVLALYGGLYLNTTTNFVTYNPALVGSGPRSLDITSPSAPSPFLQESADLSWHDSGSGKIGNFLYNGTIPANDCAIPSIVDRFPDPMPILYLRCRRGAVPTRVTSASSTDPATLIAGYNDAHAYNLAHALGYTGTSIGKPASLAAPQRTSNTTPGNHGLRHIKSDQVSTYDTTAAARYLYPYEFNLFVSDPGSPGSPRSKDAFILISPGPDRIYGTNDDITSFGSIQP